MGKLFIQGDLGWAVSPTVNSYKKGDKLYYTFDKKTGILSINSDFKKQWDLEQILLLFQNNPTKEATIIFSDIDGYILHVNGVKHIRYL